MSLGISQHMDRIRDAGMAEWGKDRAEILRRAEEQIEAALQARRKQWTTAQAIIRADNPHKLDKSARTIRRQRRLDALHNGFIVKENGGKEPVNGSEFDPNGVRLFVQSYIKNYTDRAKHHHAEAMKILNATIKGNGGPSPSCAEENEDYIQHRAHRAVAISRVKCLLGVAALLDRWERDPKAPADEVEAIADTLDLELKKAG